MILLTLISLIVVVVLVKLALVAFVLLWNRFVEKKKSISNH